ncbi:AAA family ATPase [Runella salmonicolor]|uniref:AAA family ATPase n=1 Tax=Runella salmonicolor TaxID=2950278 RepID=A0ABT1FV57_9BACT|nr:ATP-binding protein [Runella salmonicolor]MCP1385644.1 AAA family ATPase [Runella salmonicolor]
MEEIFVTKLRINKVRHLENLEIPLSETERKHLILTGKNGSGKTSVLEGINVFLNWILNNKSQETEVEENVRQYKGYRNAIKEREGRMAKGYNESYGHYQWKGDAISAQDMQSKIVRYQKFVETYVPVQLFGNVDLYSEGPFQQMSWRFGNFILKYFPSKRSFQPRESLGPQKIELKEQYDIKENANENFVRQLVNLRLDLLDAKDTGKKWEVEKVENWFKQFESTLRKAFDDESLELVFDRGNFNYNIVTKGKELFNLNQLSDGYAAFLSIVSELMMRMDKKFDTIRPYDLQGIVLIDEIETHLHIDLQKKILPFLTSFFPKIQFIVTTHSPFVLSSVDNAVIYDLEKQERVEDLSAYSYTNIVRGYFGIDEYSNEIKEKVAHYEDLINKMKGEEAKLSVEEKEMFYELKKYFKELPKSLSPELQLKILQLELAQLAQ